MSGGTRRDRFCRGGEARRKIESSGVDLSESVLKTSVGIRQSM